MSTKRIPETTQKITAVALRERGDAKQSKILRFSFTELRGSVAAESQLHGYVGVRYSHGRSKRFRESHLFTGDPREIMAGSPDVSLAFDSNISPGEPQDLRMDQENNPYSSEDESTGDTGRRVTGRRITFSPPEPARAADDSGSSADRLDYEEDKSKGRGSDSNDDDVDE